MGYYSSNNVQSSSASGGIGLTGIGFIVWIVFLTLKLCDVLPAGFTWFWVWFPLWIGPAISLSLILIVLIIAGIVYLLDR